MPKAGTYDFPADDLDRCVEKLIKARKTSNKTTQTREGFAQSMGMSIKTSTFGTLIGSMAQYGLVDTGSGQIRVTSLGEKIVFGEPKEQADSKAEAVRMVLLFADIAKQFGGTPTDEQLRLFLREEAKVELSDANETASVVGKLVKSNLPYLQSAGGGGGDKRPMTERPSTTGGAGTWALSTDSYGELRIVDDLSADFAIEAIKKFKARFQVKKPDEVKANPILDNAEAAAKHTFPDAFPSTKKEETQKAIKLG